MSESNPKPKRPRAPDVPGERIVFVLADIEMPMPRDGITERRTLRAGHAKKLIDTKEHVVKEYLNGGVNTRPSVSLGILYDFLGLDPKDPKILHIPGSVPYFREFNDAVPCDPETCLIVPGRQHGQFFMYKHWTDSGSYIPLEELFGEDLFEPIE